MRTPSSVDKLKFSPMSVEELPEVLTIERQSYPIYWAEQLFKDCIKQNYICNVLLKERTIIGYHVVQQIVDEYHILNICVAPDFLGQSLGRFQLNTIQQDAQENNINRILLEVRASNKVARKLYISSGFHIIGKRKGYYPLAQGREDALVMELALSY